MQSSGIDPADVLFTAFCSWTVLNIITRLGYIRSVWAVIGGIAISALFLAWMGRTPWHPDHALTIVVTAVVVWSLTLLVRGMRRLLKRRP